MCQRLYARIIPCFCGAHKCFGGQSESNPPHQRGRHRRRRTHVYSLLKYLGQIIDVQLVCFRGGDFADGAAALGIPTMVLDRGFAANLGALKKLIRAGEYDLVHCHGSMANVMGALLRRSVRVPVISTVHSDYRLDYLGRPVCPRRLRHAQYLGPAPARLPRVRV